MPVLEGIPRVIEADVVATLDPWRTAYCVFLEPGAAMTRKAIETVAHTFLVHTGELRDTAGRVFADIVESAVAPPGGTNWHGRWFREGTWLGGVRVRDAATFDAVKR